MIRLRILLLSMVYGLWSMVLMGCTEITPPGPKEIIQQPFGTSPLRLGMNKDKVKALWGDPDVIRVMGTNGQGMVKEEWIYRGRYPGLPVNVDYLSENQHLFFDGNNLIRFYRRRNK